MLKCCHILLLFHPGYSLLLQLGLSLSLQLNRGTGEAISIRDFNKEVRCSPPFNLEFTETCGKQAGSHHHHHSLVHNHALFLRFSLSLCAVQSADPLGELEKEQDRVPIQLTLSARQCVFLPSVCAKGCPHFDQCLLTASLPSFCIASSYMSSKWAGTHVSGVALWGLGLA